MYFSTIKTICYADGSDRICTVRLPSKSALLPPKTGLQRRLPPFLALPSPHAPTGALCEDGCSPSQRLHADLTSDHHVDASEPTCSTSTDQRPNPMKPAVALSHWWLRCALHHAETRLCISLPFSISFIANIARKRPKLNRDKTTP